ncbi:MAG: pantetheine-phosphate adenylyltransferase [Christensenellaceae bacterium]|nr:pantetheine-phosphate adenylyltransferase [Christensenellaceae bacterium]
MIKALFPGSFDPVTNGHMSIIKRSAKLFDILFVAVMVNPAKKSLFSPEKRLKMLKECCKDISNVIVISFDGLLVDLAKEKGVGIIIKGVRNSLDFESEIQQAQANSILFEGIETLLMPSSAQDIAISSTLVKQIALFGGDVTPFVPKIVADKLQNNK